MSSKTRSGMSASNRRGMVAITIVVLVLLTILFNGSRRLTQKNQGYETKKIELNQQIHDEEIREQKIAEMIGQVDSDEYIEKIAREKLGLVYEDEVVYKAGE